MSQHSTPARVPHTATDHADFEHGFKALRACAADPSPEDICPRFTGLESAFERLADAVRRRLLGTALGWTDEDKAQALWLHQANDGFAVLSYRLYQSFAKRLGIHDERTLRMMARALHFTAEALKSEVAVNPEAPHDYRRLHALMRDAMAGDHHRDPMRMRVEGREAPCTLESLYFRALLLARFASGTLNPKQVEILDAWMWLWMPALSGVPTPPPGAALRADLDSADGLRRGPREDAGSSLYLPQGPIEAAYRAVVAEFHAGRIVPSEGCAAGFRIEEHVAVLGQVRRGLRQSRRTPVVRAVRHGCDRTVEMFVGLAELVARGFTPVAPVAPSIALAAIDRKEVSPPARLLHKRDATLDDIYDAERRLLRVFNTSETGLGLEGAQADCGSISAGDLVALRLSADEPLVIGKVVRSSPAKAPGRVVVGVRRFATAPQLAAVTREHTGRPSEEIPLVFVPGDDTSGRRDAYLVSERTYTERGPLTVYLEDATFTCRFNRVRERGRGWVLAGFEVIAARPTVEAA